MLLTDFTKLRINSVTTQFYSLALNKYKHTTIKHAKHYLLNDKLKQYNYYIDNLTKIDSLYNSINECFIDSLYDCDKNTILYITTEYKNILDNAVNDYMYSNTN